MNLNHLRRDHLKLDVPDPVPYDEQLKEQHAEQSGMTRAQIHNMLSEKSESVFDPETAVAPAHNWVDRGLVMSCEGAGHPNHRSWKTGKRR